MRTQWSAVIGACAYATLMTGAQALTVGKMDIHMDNPNLFIASIPLNGHLPNGLRVHVAQGAARGIETLWWAGSPQTVAIVDHEGAPKGPIQMTLRWPGGRKVVTLPCPAVTHPPAKPGMNTINPSIRTPLAVSDAKQPKPERAVTARKKPAQNTVRQRNILVQHRVAAGDTAWGIAVRMQKSVWGQGRSVAAILEVLVKTNSKAFVAGNASELLAGSVLRIPEDAWVSAEKEKGVDVTPARSGQGARMARHRLRMAGVGERNRAHAPKTTDRSAPATAPTHSTADLDPASFLSQGWAFMDEIRVGPKERPLLELAEINNGTTTLRAAQIALAIFQTNPDAFVNGNPFQMRTGSLLKMPTLKVIQKATHAQALLWWAREQRKWG